ncbi:MAG TPA: cupin-like domain-containing protein [Rhizomicrobium sp.]|nr:cupin-like domain-containing protein [Rhizomicrobium sp.]
MPDVTLKNVPGMADAAAVPVLDAATLSEAVFQNDYVAQSRPCVIRGAVKHWPASKKWRDREYLKARSGHHEIFLYENEYHVQAKRMTAGKREINFAEAIDRLHSDATRLAIVTTALPTELLSDLGGFPFLTKAEPAYCYPPARYFFHRNAGTTWHYHPFDETLMCQVIGSKKIGLVSGNSPANLQLRRIFFAEDYYDNAAAFGALNDDSVRWFSATVEEGDALYIPPLWWHGVIPLSQGFGATAAVTWRSPPAVIANGIKKMALGEIDMIGKAVIEDFQGLLLTAQKLGLDREFAIAWARGN